MPKNTPPRKDHNRVPRAPRTLAPAEPREAERVAKVIARAGLGSRREIEEWILAGRVAVNGVVLESPAFTVTAEDAITVDGAPLPQKERTRLFMYHKPKGVVTTNYDPEGRPTLFEILPPGLPRLVSVGRLDLNTEGLILLTNDGGLSRVLELPETGWLRRYRVRAKGTVSPEKLDALIAGITVEGVHYGPIEAKLDRVQGANSWLTLALREGKNREVRNVLGALGLDVNRLIRLSYGPFQLGEIAQGAIEEVRTRVLADQLGPELSAAAGADFEGPLFDHAEAEEAPVAVRTGTKNAAKARYAKADGAEDRHRRRPIDLEESPERTVTAGIVADRKGRKVLVQRVRATETATEERPVRPPREREIREEEREAARARPVRPPKRAGGESTFRKRPDRAAPFEAGEDERPARGPRPARPPSRDRSSAGPRPARPRFEERGPREENEGAERSFQPRSERPAGDRPFRERSERPAGDRPFRERSERPSGDRPFRERSERPAGDRPFRERSERPSGDRPFRERSERPAGDRPFRERSERPAGDRPFRERSERPAGDRPFRERSERPSGDRPFRERSERPEGARPYRGQSSDRPFTGRVKSEQNRSRRPRPGEGNEPRREERPARPPREFGDRPERGERPAGKPFGEKTYGQKSFGDKPRGKSFGDRPSGGKSFGGKPGGGRSFGDKPSGGRPGGARDGAPRAGGKPGGGKPSGGRPGGKPSGGRPPRAPR
ncbi:pseudouridine synthase [Ancylobacter sp. VNQ12]|uniref:pseudouridine synthase n=1 Tax=Ancylobacter sp. VNQ12 TaxID=3400920 RepID=UPI003C0EDA09